MSIWLEFVELVVTGGMCVCVWELRFTSYLIIPLEDMSKVGKIFICLSYGQCR